MVEEAHYGIVAFLFSKSTYQQLDETKSSLRDAKDELVKSQLEYAKESMALQEVLNQTREVFNKREVVSDYTSNYVL